MLLPEIFWKIHKNFIARPWKWTTECFKSDCGHNLWIEMFFEKNEKSELANSNLVENRWKKMKKVKAADICWLFFLGNNLEASLGLT